MESCSFELSFELGLCWSIAYRAGEVTLRAISKVGKGTGLPLELFFRFGIRKVRVPAEERNETDGMYRRIYPMMISRKKKRETSNEPGMRKSERLNS